MCSHVETPWSLVKSVPSCVANKRTADIMIALAAYPTSSTQDGAVDTQNGSISYSGEPQTYIRKGPKCEWQFCQEERAKLSARSL